MDCWKRNQVSDKITFGLVVKKDEPQKSNTSMYVRKKKDWRGRRRMEGKELEDVCFPILMERNVFTQKELYVGNYRRNYIYEITHLRSLIKD